MRAEIWLITSRAAWETFKARQPTPGDVWLGADVLSDVERARLQSTGWKFSVFVDVLDPSDGEDIADRMNTVSEHHPGATVLVA